MSIFPKLTRSILRPEADLRSVYQTQCNKFAGFCREAGLDVTPYRDGELAFDRLPAIEQAQVLELTDLYVGATEKLVQGGGSLRDEQQFLWSFISELGLRPTSDLFARLDDGNLIEIYNSEFVQIYRNLFFFQFCSYTLDEILSLPWYKLFSRDEPVTKQLLDESLLTLAGKYRTTHTLAVGRHQVAENASDFGYVAEVENRFISPLVDGDGKIQAGVVISHVYWYRKQLADIPKRRDLSGHEHGLR